MRIFQPDLSHPYAQMQTSLGALATHWSNESGSQKMVSIKMCSIILFTVGPSAARRLRLFMRNLRTRRKRKKNLTLSKKCLRVSFICISNNAEKCFSNGLMLSFNSSDPLWTLLNCTCYVLGFTIRLNSRRLETMSTPFSNIFRCSNAHSVRKKIYHVATLQLIVRGDKVSCLPPAFIH